MEGIRKQNPPPQAAGSVPGWPLQGPFSRSPEARKVAPWVQGLSSVVHLSNLRHVVYRDAVKKACACSVFRRVVAMVKLNLAPGLHTLMTSEINVTRLLLLEIITAKAESSRFYNIRQSGE